MDTFLGLDTFGGLLRKGHVERLFKSHALAMSLTRHVLQFSDVNVDTFGGIGHVWEEGHVSECYIYMKTWIFYPTQVHVYMYSPSSNSKNFWF